MAKDYYSILGVTKSASKEDIAKAFRKLAHKYHPDKKGGDETRFKEISEAYSVLSDSKKKAEYDAYGRVFEGGGSGGSGFGGFGAEGFDFSNFSNFSGFQGGDFDIGDIFGEFFSGGRGGSRTRRGRDISIDLEISFRDAVFGTERNVLLTKTSACDACGGSGAKAGTAMVSCGTCNGKGKIHETKRSILGAFTSVRVCETCLGTGAIPQEKCAACHGQGILRKEEEVRIGIPPGLESGEVIRLSGRGEAVKAGVAGDMYVKIHVRPDPLFKKEGTNIVMTLDLKLSDALLGGSYTVHTLDGDIDVTIPPGISHNEVLRVRGKGIPLGSHRRGDLLIRVRITIPNKLSKKAREAINQLRSEGI